MEVDPKAAGGILAGAVAVTVGACRALGLGRGKEKGENVTIIRGILEKVPEAYELRLSGVEKAVARIDKDREIERRETLDRYLQIMNKLGDIHTDVAVLKKENT